MFPTWVRGTAQQKPSDTFVQQYLDDVAGEINAVLNRRFATAISTASSFSAWIAALPLDASNILEKINRYGAAAQLGEALATFGVASARELGKTFRDAYLEMLNQLDARDTRGTPLPSGRYDKQFDSVARTETPRPALQAVPGGDQDPKQTPSDVGLSNVFGKFDKRGK
jgi:hypothetical protein